MKTVTIKKPCRVDGVNRAPGDVVETSNDQAMRLVAHGWATAGLSHGKTPPAVEHRDPVPDTRDPETEMPKRKPK